VGSIGGAIEAGIKALAHRGPDAQGIVRRIGPYLSQKRLRFKTRSPGTELLIQQLRDFPVGDHDDGPDALWSAIELAIELVNGRQQSKGPTRLTT
jgi:hypothetical protein